MTSLRDLVSELARIGEGPPVVTLFLDVRWRDEQQRDRIRLFFSDEFRKAKQLFADRPEWVGLAATFERLGEWVDAAVNQDAHVDAHSVMLVASEPRKLFQEIWLGDAVDLQTYVDTVPHLFPLIDLASFQRPVFLACVESTGADILELQLGEVVEEQVLQRPVPRRHHEGGWSQKRFARHTREVIRGVWEECAGMLARFAADPKADVILFGTEENLRAFERLLPRALSGRIIGLRPLAADRREVLNVAREVSEEEKVAREFALVHRILRQGLSDRTGVVGLDDALLAVNERRVRVLALSRRFNPPGFECTICHALSRTGATGCVFCGGRTTSVLLREPLARRCLVDGGDLVVVPDGGPLDAYRGIGCLLRHLSGVERRSSTETASLASPN